MDFKLQPNGITIPDDGGEYTLTSDATIITPGLAQLGSELTVTDAGTRIRPNGFCLTVLEPEPGAGVTVGKAP